MDGFLSVQKIYQVFQTKEAHIPNDKVYISSKFSFVYLFFILGIK